DRDPEGLGQRPAALARVLPGGRLRRVRGKGRGPRGEAHDGPAGLPRRGTDRSAERSAGRPLLPDPADRRRPLTFGRTTQTGADSTRRSCRIRTASFTAPSGTITLIRKLVVARPKTATSRSSSASSARRTGAKVAV